jgi:hypothetical protein
MTLRERMQAMAEEYQRSQRWLRSVDVGKMMDSWLSEPEIQPGPCMEQAPTLTTGVRSVSCTLLAGHAGGHTNGVTSWKVAPSPDADVERADFRPGLGPETPSVPDFRVRREQSGWRVSLPHQCDSWDIAGDEYSSVDTAEAVTELERFLADGQAALAALKAGQEYGLR